MSARVRVRTESYTNARTWGSLGRDGGVTDGVVFTPYGIVSVAQYASETGAMTFMNVIHRGRLWRRVIDGRSHTERGLSIVAARFAREVASGKVRP